MSDHHPYPEAGYHDEYSDEDSVPSQANGSGEPASKRKRVSNPPSPRTHTARARPVLSPRDHLEASWINAEPFDEFIRGVADFIAENSRGRNNIEIEAKIGLLIDKTTNQRVNFPVMSEIILAPQYQNIRFESNMNVEQHAHYNRLLNQRVAITTLPDYSYAKMAYAHTKVIDSFHTVQGQKIRVTTDEKTGVREECVSKVRIADLNIYNPKRKVDWRVSVNVETPVPPPSALPENTRRKDRMTYTHQAFQIDLTQVTSSYNPGQLQHELEVEFRDPNELLRFATLREQGHEDGWAFDELVRVFVNNASMD